MAGLVDGDLEDVPVAADVHATSPNGQRRALRTGTDGGHDIVAQVADTAPDV
jgi:hypothetical protein